MKKFMDWLSNKFAPKMNQICQNPWISALSAAIMRGLPFILLGSLISIYSIVRSYIPILPDLSKISDFSFGMFSVFMAFLLAYEAMEKLKHAKYQVPAGLASVSVFIMFMLPAFDSKGNMTVIFGRFGAQGMIIGLLAGFFVSIIMNLYSKLGLFKNNVSLPDFITDWINQIIPIGLALLIAMLLVFQWHLDVFQIITNLFSPIISFGQTLPGFIIICFVPAVFYSMGISSWLFSPAEYPIMMTGIIANIAAAKIGQMPTNIVTAEVIFTAGFIGLGGMGATLGLNFLMLRAKSKKLRVLGKVTLIPSLFNINEPLIFGAPIAFNPILMLPMWINSITGPIIVWIFMMGGIVKIPSMLVSVGQIPAPFSSVLVTQDVRAVILWAVLLAVYTLTWVPFFKVYDSQCLKEEQEQEKAIEA